MVFRGPRIFAGCNAPTHLFQSQPSSRASEDNSFVLILRELSVGGTYWDKYDFISKLILADDYLKI